MKNLPLSIVSLLVVLFSWVAPVNAETTITYHHHDLLGTPVVSTDEFGDVVETKRYSPFGEQDVQSNDPGRGGSLGYTGHAYDQQLDLVNMGARMYDPKVGVFMGWDPAGVDPQDPLTFNRYIYAKQNPYKYIDPDGRAAETPWDALNVGMGAVSFAGNIAVGNWGGALIDAGGLLYDGFATAVPVLPGGAATAINGYRTTKLTVNGVKYIDDAANVATAAYKKQSGVVDNLVGELTYSKRSNVKLEIPGGVAGAIRHTRQTGELVGGSDHIQKGRDILGKLKKVRKRINNSHDMSSSERSSLLKTVNHHIDDLSNALK